MILLWVLASGKFGYWGFGGGGGGNRVWSMVWWCGKVMGVGSVDSSWTGERLGELIALYTISNSYI